MNYQIRLEGLRPLMFDRYPGDNSTQLPVKERAYLDANKHLIIPALNIYSMLAAENTKSVCRQFWGKQGKTIALGIAGYVNIEPFHIPILCDGKPMTINDLKIQYHVARLNKGIPNPKERPMIETPWSLDFIVEYTENKYCTLENLRQSFTMGGSIGLGTFRPYFGRYKLTRFEQV